MGTLGVWAAKHIGRRQQQGGMNMGAVQTYRREANCSGSGVWQRASSAQLYWCSPSVGSGCSPGVGEQRQAGVSQQEGCSPSVGEAWWEEGQILCRGGKAAAYHHPKAFLCASQCGWDGGKEYPCHYAGTSSFQVCLRIWARGLWCADDIPSVHMIFLLSCPWSRQSAPCCCCQLGALV